MRSLGSARALGVRCPQVIGCLLGILCAGAPAVHAQELSEDEIVTLGVMGEAMLSRGTLNGGDDDMVEILELSWAYGLPDLEATPDDARELLRFSREDRERRSRYGGVLFRFGAGAPGVLRVGQKLTCDQMREKALQARRVAGALRKVSGMYMAAGVALGASSTIVGTISQRFLWPIGFAALVVNVAAYYADDLATAYQNAPCGASRGGGEWRPESIRTGDALEPSTNPGALPYSRLRRSGCLPAA